MLIDLNTLHALQFARSSSFSIKTEDSCSASKDSKSDDKLTMEDPKAKFTEDCMNNESRATSAPEKTEGRPSAYPGEHASTRFLEVCTMK